MSLPSPELIVEGIDETAGGSVDLRRWCAVATSTLTTEGVVAGRLDLIFVEPDAIAELNRHHLGHEGPTDVLAFPIDGPGLAGMQEGESSGGPTLHLGDVVICPEVAAAQAEGHTGALEAELTLLVVHGVLHVLGHDHAEAAETQQMQDRERVHLRRHGFEHPVPS